MPAASAAQDAMPTGTHMHTHAHTRAHTPARALLRLVRALAVGGMLAGGLAPR